MLEASDFILNSIFWRAAQNLSKICAGAIFALFCPPTRAQGAGALATRLPEQKRLNHLPRCTEKIGGVTPLFSLRNSPGNPTETLFLHFCCIIFWKITQGNSPLHKKGGWPCCRLAQGHHLKHVFLTAMGQVPAAKRTALEHRVFLHWMLFLRTPCSPCWAIVLITVIQNNCQI